MILGVGLKVLIYRDLNVMMKSWKLKSICVLDFAFCFREDLGFFLKHADAETRKDIT